MRKPTKSLIIIFVFLLAIYFVWALTYQKVINTPVDENDNAEIFVIEKGESVNNIAVNLEDKEFIKSKYFFELYLKKNNLEKKVQAGEYELSRSMNIKEIVKLLTAGEVVDDELTIKIIEGWSIADMDKYLSTNNIIQSGDFIQITKNNFKEYQEEYEFLSDSPKNAGLEGYIFPDTYKIFKDSTAEDIVEKTLNNFDKKLTKEMKDEIARQNKTIFEIMTMASVIEKEVRSVEDMKIVSGIFWNRIGINKPLESCATLAYILGVNKPQYSVEDTKIKSPYNTYQNYGLPPGPISNPGLNAIVAAIYPEKTNYYYFLSRPDNGETVFAKTYDEHLNNKARYLK
ncbi:MAG: endolytic transglycosylase MltG [bacterium]